jgi:hypothetical protein
LGFIIQALSIHVKTKYDTPFMVLPSTGCTQMSCYTGSVIQKWHTKTKNPTPSKICRAGAQKA